MSNNFEMGASAAPNYPRGTIHPGARVKPALWLTSGNYLTSTLYLFGGSSTNAVDDIPYSDLWRFTSTGTWVRLNSGEGDIGNSRKSAY